MSDPIVEKLTQMLEAAKAGKMKHLAYHHDDGRNDNWGFVGVSNEGKFIISARLAALAVEDDKKQEAAQ